MLMRWDLFDNMIRSSEARETFPVVDVYEDKKKITLEAEVPGINLDDISVKLDKNILTIEGKKSVSNGKDKKYWRSERSISSFKRSFSLPPSIEVKKIQAFCDKGVLKIEAPKKLEAMPRKIEIKSTG